MKMNTNSKRRFEVTPLWAVTALVWLLLLNNCPADLLEASRVSLWPGHLRGKAQGIDVVGNYAYVGAWNGGLRVFDVSDPANPVWIGSDATFEDARKVLVVGGYAYVVANGKMHIVDVSDPSLPVSVGEYDPSSTVSTWASDMVYDGQYLYLSTSRDVQVLGLSDPIHPTMLGSVQGGYPHEGLAVSGSYVYLAGHSKTVEVIDVGNPAAPVSVGKGSQSSASRSVAVSGSHAYVVGHTYSLQVVNVSDPTQPSTTNNLDIGSSWAVDTSGQHVYVGSDEGLHIVDSSDPDNPVEVGTFITDSRVYDLEVIGQYVYLAADSAGLLVIDVTNPTNAVLHGAYSAAFSPGVARDVTIDGHRAYLADDGGGLQIIDMSDPADPVQTGHYASTNSVLDVSLAGNYAYLAMSIHGLEVIDRSVVTNPVWVAGYDTGSFAMSVVVSGGLAYVANASAGLLILDVSDPLNPQFSGAYDTPGWATRVAVSGDYAFVADDWGGLQIIDVSNPASPAGVGSYDDFFGRASAQDLVVSGSYAFVAHNLSSLYVIDVSDPAHPVQESSRLWINSGAESLTLSGNWLYVGGRTGVTVYDISNPSSLSQVSSYSTATSVEGLAASGDYCHAAVGSWGLETFKVEIPDLAVEVPPADTSVVLTETAIFSLEAVGAQPMTYQWRKGGAPMLETVIPELILTNVQLVDAGLYDAVVTNIQGMVTSTVARLTVLQPEPGISVQPEDQLGYPGETVIFSAEVTGLTQRSYQWRKDGVNVQSEGASSIVLTNLQFADAGAYDLVVSNAYGMVTSSVAVLTVAPGTLVELVGQWSAGDGVERVYDVTVAENRAYLAYGQAGLIIMDVTDPSNPAYLGEHDTVGETLGVAVVGDYVYLADASRGLEILNVEDPTNPVWVGGYEMLSSARAVVVVDQYAYMADYAAGLHVINVSNPTNPVPVHIGQHGSSWFGHDLAIQGSHAYLANGEFLQVIDVSNPATPVGVGSYNISSGSVFGVAVVGDTVFTANFAGGLDVAELVEPATLSQLSNYDTGGYSYDVEVVGSHAYVGDQDALLVMDVSDLHSPKLAGRYDLLQGAHCVTVLGSLAYTGGPAGFFIFQIGPDHLEFVPNAGTPAVSDGTFTTRLIGPPEVTAITEVSSESKDWVPISTNTIPPGGVLLTLPMNTNSQQLYRAWTP